MAVLLIGLIVGLTLAAAGYGLWLVARGIAADAVIGRRLARGRAAEAAAIEPAREDPRSPFARLVDARLPGLRRRLEAARAPVTPVQVVVGSACLTLGLLLMMQVAHVPFLAGLFAAAWGGLAGPPLLISTLAARRRRMFTRQMPQTVDLIARSLQAGHPVTTAMTVAAEQMPDPIGPELGVVIAEMRHGLDRDAALRNLLQRFPIPELRMFAASLEVTRETGGNLAEVFLKLGEALRAKSQLKQKVHAISAEGRITFWVVAALPLLVGGAILVLNPDYYREVMKDPLFWPMMCEPLVMLTLGSVIIWRMVNIEV